MEEFVNHVLPHFQSGKLRPIVDRILPMKDIRKAHLIMESSQNIGKIVIEVRNDGEKEEL